MTITVETGAEGRCKAAMKGKMTIDEAAADKPVLLTALPMAKEMEIDLSSLHEMDTAGLQLLILLKRESLKAGRVMRLVRHSPATLEVLHRYDLAPYFADPVVISAGAS
jgi:anti-sigma B factor antagonist